MNKCANCGYESTKKKKLTLSIDANIINEAKKQNINISEFLETQLIKEFRNLKNE